MLWLWENCWRKQIAMFIQNLSWSYFWLIMKNRCILFVKLKLVSWFFLLSLSLSLLLFHCSKRSNFIHSMISWLVFNGFHHIFIWFRYIFKIFLCNTGILMNASLWIMHDFFLHPQRLLYFVVSSVDMLYCSWFVRWCTMNFCSRFIEKGFFFSYHIQLEKTQWKAHKIE